MQFFKASNYSQAQNLSPFSSGVRIARTALSKPIPTPPGKNTNLPFPSRLYCQHPPPYQSVLIEHDSEIFLASEHPKTDLKN